MAPKVFVRDSAILSDLQAELGQFSTETYKVLEEISRNIARDREYLFSRINYWNAELRKREIALRGCRSSNDENRNCSSEIMAVEQAHNAIGKLQKLSSRFEQAVGEYQPHHNRLKRFLDEKIGKAQGQLQHSLEKYRQYLQPKQQSLGNQFSGSREAKTSSARGAIADSQTSPKKGITWAEKRAILMKIDNRQSISMEEFQKLKLPITDLKAETLQEDYSWIQNLIKADRFREATQGLWTDEAPAADLGSVVWSLLGVGADVLRMIRFWKNG